MLSSISKVEGASAESAFPGFTKPQNNFKSNLCKWQVLELDILPSIPEKKPVFTGSCKTS